MGVAAVYKTSHSHFLGGPRQWTQEDRDKAIWHQAWQSRICGGCGTHPDEWDPDKGGHPAAYRAVQEICPGCETLRRGAEVQKAKDARKRIEPNPNARMILQPREVLDAGHHGSGEQHRTVQPSGS